MKTLPLALVIIVGLTDCKKAGHPGRPPLPGTTGITGLEFQPTNTQAVVTYDAPAAQPCRIEASESANYAPLVHDIDTALFAGENSDWRVGSYIEGTKHTFVLGKRLVAKAADGKYYSRALQAATMHYVRVNCGGLIATGTFTTQTIPYGVTYQDVPQLDPARPGMTMNPTIIDSRAQRIIDPHTGAEVRAFSLPSDIPYEPGNSNTSGPKTWDAPYQRPCGTQPIGPSPGGYLCGWPQGDGGTGVIYYLTTGGETRYLGKNAWNAAYPYLNAVDSKFYVTDNDSIWAYTYTGNFQQASAGSIASFSRSTIISGLCAAVHAFNAKFEPSYYCSPAQLYGITATGDFIALQFRRGIQDSYGWVIVVQISTGRVVGTMRPDQNAQMRWCGLHNTYSLYSEPAWAIEIHGFVGQSYPLGGGPYTTTVTAAVNPGSTAITVAGDLQCARCGPDPDAPSQLQVGDYIHWQDGTNNTNQVTARADAQHITITGTHDPHPAGASFEGACQYRSVYWKALEDPYGVDASGQHTVSDGYWPGTGHDDAVTDPTNHANDAILTEHWPIRVGPILAGLGSPLSRTISSEPMFAGAFCQAYGNGGVSHPAAGAPGQTYMTDYFKYDGAGADNGKLTLLSGQLYRYVHNPDYPKADIKHYAIATVHSAGWLGGPYSFRDVSGIKSVLPADASGSYQWCRANAAGECIQGSAEGEEFVNVPGSPSMECGGNTSLCINNMSAYVNGVVEIGYDGQHSRVLTGGLTGLRDSNNYPNAKGTGHGEFVIFPYGDVTQKVPARLMLVKRPPAPCQPDGIDRSTFVRHPVQVTAPAGKNVATAAVEFGYEEFGSPNDHFCTSRREPCVATSETVNDANPFHYAQTETYTRAPCAESCTITLPVLPMHIAFYQVRFFDAAGTLVSSSGGAVARE